MKRREFVSQNKGIFAVVLILFSLWFCYSIEKLYLAFVTGWRPSGDSSMYMFAKYNCTDFLLDRKSNGTVLCDNGTKTVNLTEEDFKVYQKWLDREKIK